MTERRWMDVRAAAEYTLKSEETVRVALRSGELKGVQPKKNASWRTCAEWLDAWLEGRTLPAAA